MDMQKITKRYNDLVESLGYEHVQIGTSFSEGTEGWNLRDMVAECDYILQTYYECGHMNGDLRYSYYPEERRMWRSETAKLSRFIERYKAEALKMTCTEKHCSQYDDC